MMPPHDNVSAAAQTPDLQRTFREARDNPQNFDFNFALADAREPHPTHTSPPIDEEPTHTPLNPPDLETLLDEIERETPIAPRKPRRKRALIESPPPSPTQTPPQASKQTLSDYFNLVQGPTTAPPLQTTTDTNPSTPPVPNPSLYSTPRRARNRINVATFNVNGLCGKGAKLFHAFYHSTYDILLIQSHNLDKERAREWERVLMRRYAIAARLSTGPPNKTGTGSGILIKTRAVACQATDITFSSHAHGRATLAHWSEGPFPMRLLSLYLPPDAQERRKSWLRITKLSLITHPPPP